MRIGIARIAQESSTFSPVLTDMNTLQANGIFRGRAVLETIPGYTIVDGKYRADSEATRLKSNIPGFLDVVGDEDLVGIISVHALPAGPLTEDAMNTVLNWFTEDLKKALPLDGLLLDLHGAFVGVADPDFEGLVLERARQIVGDKVCIGVAFDLHANITRRKIENADIICGYHTHPHVDSRNTARKVARLLAAALQKNIRPVISAVKIPMITQAERQLTQEFPMSELMAEMRRQESDERVLSSSIFAVQPLLDIPEMGWCTVVVADGAQRLADRFAIDLADMAWNQREQYNQPCPTYVEAINDAFSSEVHPVVIADFADMMTGGGTGDSTWFLKDLLSRKPKQPCYLTMVDPQAVKYMAKAGEAAEVTLKLGGKQDNIHSTPVEVTGRVHRVRDFASDRELPQNRMANSIGPMAVLQIENIYVVVLERMGEGADPGIYLAAGLDPQKAKILIAKSIVDFRFGYKGIAKRFLLGEAPGLCPSNLLSLQWQNVPRPIFPLDESIFWDSKKAAIYRR